MSIRIEDLHTLDFSDVIDPHECKLKPIHPGELLAEEFLKPMGISNYRLASTADRRNHRGPPEHHG